MSCFIVSNTLEQEYPHVRRGSDLPPDILFCSFNNVNRTLCSVLRCHVSGAVVYTHVKVRLHFPCELTKELIRPPRDIPNLPWPATPCRILILTSQRFMGKNIKIPKLISKYCVIECYTLETNGALSYIMTVK